MRNNQEPSGLVLIIEDNRNISEMVGEYLESKGFEVDYAGDGLDGYRLAAENTYDVIILDLMLPRMDGLEVCRRLREEARKAEQAAAATSKAAAQVEPAAGAAAAAPGAARRPRVAPGPWRHGRRAARRPRGCRGG